jgi:hypothetical protein
MECIDLGELLRVYKTGKNPASQRRRPAILIIKTIKSSCNTGNKQRNEAKSSTLGML